ncbi:MAG TPA: EAL domain-containing protein [Solirubrobacteraceae bacterium]|nr:EAL domain-containing protein [Solirubrobacteraceae bacterium]
MDRAPATAGDHERTRQPGRGVALAHALALFVGASLIWLTSGLDQWRIGLLLVLLAFTTVSAVADIRTAVRTVTISGVPIGLITAIVLLGPGPAALIGAVTMIAFWTQRRTAWYVLVNNVTTFMWYPLVAGLLFRETVHLGHIGPDAMAYYLVVFPTFVVALVVNFFGVIGFRCYLDRSSLAEAARLAVIPIMSAELFSALLTMGAAYVAVQAGMAGVVLIGVAILVFQYLIGELLKSKARGEELRRMATTDELTGLPNREVFRRQLDDRIASAKAHNENFAVMLLDLDRFKEVNDTLGHHYGDELLRDLGPRLAEVIGPEGLVARLGGDEFAILPADTTGDTDDLEAIALRLIECVRRPVRVDEMTLEVGGSVGVSRFPRDGDDPHSLLRSADVAMYAAKEAHVSCKVYAAALDRHSVRRLSVLSEFRRALASDEIEVFYQPIMRMDGTLVHGAEGLVRWQHPELGLLPPSDFIPIVEQTDLIAPLTRHVLERAVADCSRWRRERRDLTVSVNLSVRNLLDPELPPLIGELLERYDLAAEALQLEITESMLMSDPDRSLLTLTALSQLGVGLSVDDYGTGYSSLANLRRLPIDELKLDRSFVSPMLSDENDLIIVRSTINLGHDLGLTVVAEGIEDEATLTRLADLGCDLAQGYYFSKPLPSREFDAFIGLPVEAEAQPAAA